MLASGRQQECFAVYYPLYWERLSMYRFYVAGDEKAHHCLLQREIGNQKALTVAFVHWSLVLVFLWV